MAAESLTMPWTRVPTCASCQSVLALIGFHCESLDRTRDECARSLLAAAREPSRAAYATVVVASSVAAAAGFTVFEDVFGTVGVVPAHRWSPLL